MTVKAKVVLSKDLKKLLKDRKTVLNKAIRVGGMLAGKEYVRYLSKEMSKKGRSGRAFKQYVGIGGRKLASPRLSNHSAVGEYPAVITGGYRKGLDFDLDGAKYLNLGNTSDYAGYLEKSRKPLERALNDKDSDMVRIIERELFRLFE